MLKVLTVCGTRPDIIRMSQVIKRLDTECKQILVHTGQSFSENMSDVFFDDLNIRKPDEQLSIGGDSPANQLGKLFTGIEQLIYHHEPDRFLILGDTNTAMSAIVAKRMKVPVYHMEAGNRCFSDDVPEEVNRRIIDHASDVHLAYTERARANLLREGIASHKIFVTGNPIWEVIKDLPQTGVLKDLNLMNKKYFLVTAHREENVDNEYRLICIANSLVVIATQYEVIFSCHPRTRKKLEAIGFAAKGVIVHEPFGLLDFLTLERNAYCILTDSGTVQEEACLFNIPCVTLRDNTERPETIECGSNFLSGVLPDTVLNGVMNVTTKGKWEPPSEYLRDNVAQTVVNIVTGF